MIAYKASKTDDWKRNIKDLWWKSIVKANENVVGMDAAILMHPRVWEASGHVENFHDPLIDNKETKKEISCRSFIK